MKRLFCIIMFFVCSVAFGQLSQVEDRELSPDAAALKKHYPDKYAGFSDFAVRKWGDDYEMIVEEINKQTQAFITVFSSEYERYSDLRREAMNKWGLERGDRELEGNPKIDWVMVQYEMDKQLRPAAESSVEDPTLLNTRSQRYREEMPEAYEGIKQMAVEQWGDDHRMVVYEINQQIEAVDKVGEYIKKWDEDEALKKIVIGALTKWSKEDASDPSKKTINWRMVAYEIDTQLKALKSY